MGEYHREYDYFSHSRLEDNDDDEDRISRDISENDSELEPAVEAGVETASEVSAEINSNEAGINGDGEATVEKPKNPLERQVSRLLAQVNGVSWNHVEFRVRYHSLAAEPRVGNYFLRLLLEEHKRMGSEEAADPSPNASTIGLSRIKNR